MDFFSSLASRKLILTIAAAVGIVLYPDAQEGILTLLGIYVGGNVVQKFTAAEKAIRTAVTETTAVVQEVAPDVSRFADKAQ